MCELQINVCPCLPIVIGTVRLSSTNLSRRHSPKEAIVKLTQNQFDICLLSVFSQPVSRCCLSHSLLIIIRLFLDFFELMFKKVDRLEVFFVLLHP